MSHQGSCLCKKVTIRATKLDAHFGACHCVMCRKWGGGPFLTVDAGTDVTIQGKEFVGVYDSSAWAERAFCKSCGTHLFYRLKEKQQYILSLGLMEGTDALPFDHQVFIDQKPANYRFANETKVMTGAELFAAAQKAK